MYWAVMAALVCVFLFSGWKLFEIWRGQNQISQETETYAKYLTQNESDDSDSADDVLSEDPSSVPEVKEEYFNPDWASLKAANPNIVGWIIVPGTGISYPVVQGADNDYYLTRTYTGQSNRLGSVFLDAAASSDFTTDNSIIYGHSVDIGGMFTNLKDFADQSFFESHPYFWLLTPDGNYQCEITVFYQGADDAAVYYSEFGDEESRKTILNAMQNESTYFRGINPENYGIAAADAHYVTLSTCNLNYGFNSDQRYVLTALMVPYKSQIPVSEAA
jgi:sortase B